MQSMLGLARIKKHYGNLGEAERRVADFVLNDWKRIITMPVSKFADKAQVSQATVVRFCRSIGFKGFAEFKMCLSSARLSPEANVFDIKNANSEAVVAQMISRFNQDAIHDTQSTLNMEMLKKAAEALDKARHVLIFAEGGSACSARCAYEVFNHIGVPCVMVEDAMYQILATARLKKGDVALTVCHSGRDRNIIENVGKAREVGATTVSISGMVGSTLAKLSDIILYTGLYDHPFFSETIAARICELNVISVVHALVSFRRQDTLTDHRQPISDLLDIKRLKK